VSSEAAAAEREVLDTADSTTQVNANRQELIERCRVDLDFLASLILTDIYQYGYPGIFKAAWQMLCAAALEPKGKPKYALGIPRGFAKTIVLKLYVVWLVLFSDRQFILVVCNTATHANNFVSDVADMLDSPNIKAIFGDWRVTLEKDTQELKKFSFRGRNIVLAGLGSGGSPRGLNIKFLRPDVVIMDDMQNRDEAANPEIAKTVLTWMLGTLMKACHPQRCVFTFVGNMYPFEGSILRKLKHSAEWTSFITAAITVDGKSIWEEHRGIEDLLQELAFDTEQGMPELFYAEVMNDEEAGTVSGIDVSKIPAYPEHLSNSWPQGGFVLIDPSLAKKKSDDTGMGLFLVHDGVPVLREAASRKMDPGQTIETAIFLAVKYNVSAVVIEGVAYQASLIFWFEQVLKKLNISGIKVLEISSAGMQKNARIRDMLKLLLAGKLPLHPEVRSAILYQITQWNPMKTDNKDDLLDVMAYAHTVLNTYRNDIAIQITLDLDSDTEAVFTADLALAF
jgi:hypothetical protein